MKSSAQINLANLQANRALKLIAASALAVPLGHWHSAAG
jgi:hypothetical protein